MAKSINVAQIGCGYWGKNLVRNFHELGALAAVCDGDAQTAQTMHENYKVPIKRFDEIIADSNIDAISLASPAPSHAELAIAALNAGKHVFVEKPLALNTDDAEAVLKASQQNDKIVMVGHLLQYHPIFQKTKALIAEGKLGKLNYVYSNRMSLGKFRIEENVLWSFSPHDISMVLAVAGEEPNKICAHGASFVTSGIEDFSMVHLAFPSGLKGHIQASWAHPFKEQRLVVIGENGALVFEDSQAEWEKKLAFYPHEIDLSSGVPLPQKGEVEYIEVEKSEPLKSECNHFIQSCLNSSAPISDGAEGLRVLKVLQAAEDQLKSGGK